MTKYEIKHFQPNIKPGDIGSHQFMMSGVGMFIFGLSGVILFGILGWVVPGIMSASLSGSGVTTVLCCKFVADRYGQT